MPTFRYVHFVEVTRKQIGGLYILTNILQGQMIAVDFPISCELFQKNSSTMEPAQFQSSHDAHVFRVCFVTLLQHASQTTADGHRVEQVFCLGKARIFGQNSVKSVLSDGARILKRILAARIEAVLGIANSVGVL